MKPGVYKLSDDARIFQLVDMAGGFTPNADRESLNLAEILADGVHIHIGAQSQATRGQSLTIPGMPARIVQPSSSLVNINTASSAELESLPGVGKVTAQRIIDYRNTHGNFDSPEDLVNVRGIGKSKLAHILPHITAMNTGSKVVQSQSSAAKIDINRATAKQLEQLPGVGPVTAKRIVDYRNTNGKFDKLQDLVNVRGISWAKLDVMRDMITVR